MVDVCKECGQDKLGSQVSKLKVFMDTFHKLSEPWLVEENKLRHNLIMNHFTEEQADEYIEKAIKNGQIYIHTRLFSKA